MDEKTLSTISISGGGEWATRLEIWTAVLTLNRSRCGRRRCHRLNGIRTNRLAQSGQTEYRMRTNDIWRGKKLLLHRVDCSLFCIIIRFRLVHSTQQWHRRIRVIRRKKNIQFGVVGVRSMSIRCSDEHFIFTASILMAPGFTFKQKLNWIMCVRVNRPSNGAAACKSPLSRVAGKVFYSKNWPAWTSTRTKAEKKRGKNFSKTVSFFACWPFPFRFRAALCVSALIVKLLFFCSRRTLQVRGVISLWRSQSLSLSV